jgi:hypothetical protein
MRWSQFRPIPAVLAQNRTIGALSAAASQPLVKAPIRRYARIATS